MEKGIERNKIEEEKEELLKWKKKIKKYLGINTYKQEEFFLISKYWFEKYKNNFLNFKLDRRNSIVFLNKMKEDNNELFTPFTDKEIEISKLPRIFVLNKTIWLNILNENHELSTITAVGYYSNKLLTLKVLDLVYCFIFIDRKDRIRQGYLEIINKKDEDKIIKEFKQKGFFEFIKENEKEYSDENINFKTNDYKMYVFKNFIKDEENKKTSEKDDGFETKIIQRERAKTIRASFYIKNKHDEEFNYFYGTKVFTFKKSKKIDEKEKMGTITKIFKKFLSMKDYFKNKFIDKNKKKTENKKEEKKQKK